MDAETGKQILRTVVAQDFPGLGVSREGDSGSFTVDLAVLR